MKLIMALCDALGFEVEKYETPDSIKYREYVATSSSSYGIIPTPKYDYKLTKKDSPPFERVPSKKEPESDCVTECPDIRRMLHGDGLKIMQEEFNKAKYEQS